MSSCPATAATGTISLNGAWEVVERPLADGVEAFAHVRDATATLQCAGFG